MIKYRTYRFFLLFLISLVLFGCSDVILNKTTKGLEVQLVTPSYGSDAGVMARSGGNVDVSLMLTWQVRAWLTDESSASTKKIIQTITKDVESGKVTALSFDPVEPGTAVKVHVELVLKESGEKSYEGASDVFTVLPEGNSVAIQLKEVSEDETDTEDETEVEDETDTEGEGEDETEGGDNSGGTDTEGDGDGNAGGTDTEGEGNDNAGGTDTEGEGDNNAGGTDTEGEGDNTEGEGDNTEGEGDNTGGTTPSQPPATATITNQAQLQDAISKASAGDEILIENSITIQDTLVIDKNIKIKGSENISLLRSTNGTVTGPMIEVKMGCELDLSNITLDGQWNNPYTDGENNPYTDGENNPLIYVNSGVLLLTGVELKNNHMVYYGTYTDKSSQQVHLYSAAAIYALDSQLMIMDSNFTTFSANDGKGGVINIEGTYQDAAGITISDTTIEPCVGSSNRALQMGSDDEQFGYISYDINNKWSGLGRQIMSITPTSP